MDTREQHSRKNPVGTANFLSVLFFGWTVPIFWKGSKRDLILTDLYDPLEPNESERLGDLLEREWNKELVKANQAAKDGKKNPARQPNLMWAITRMFWVPYTVLGILTLVESTVLSLLQPILQGWIISYFDDGENLMTKNQVLLYAGYLVFLTFVVIVLGHQTIHRQRVIGMRVRVACCSMMYRKILRLNQSAANSTNAGRIANLMSNDVARFDVLSPLFHHIWIMPIQVSLIGYMMWEIVGVAGLVGIGALIMQNIPIQGYFSRLSKKFRGKISAETDKRVQLMSELVSGMKVVKMYSWEKPFEFMVSKIRNQEIKFISQILNLKGLNLSITVFSEKISLYFTLITFVLMGNTLTAQITFVIVGLFARLKKTCNIFVPRALIVVSETSVSLERITNFLLLNEVGCDEQLESTANKGPQYVEKTETSQEIDPQVEIEMIKVTANWVHDQLPPTLSEVSTQIASQSLCALVGPVGSGKSSLLHLVMGELPIQTGRMSLFADEANTRQTTGRDIRISYASQNPWLFSASIRDNILFGQPYDERRYRKVTRVCALLEDFEQLPQGDLTFVGERGAAISGGQKARVNLARAVYRDADLYLFDDPLSAVDPRVGRHLFEECIAGFLKGKTRILVTHQLQYLRQADTVVVLNRGTVECQGTYDELVTENSNIFNSGVPEEPDQLEGTEEIREEKADRKVTVTADEGANNQASEAGGISEGSSDIIEEEIATGITSKKVYWEYFSAGGNMCSLALVAIVFIAAQIAVSGTDYWVGYWANQETFRTTTQLNKSVSDHTNHGNDTKDEPREIHFTESQWFDENGLLYQNLGIYIYTACLISCMLLVTLRSILFVKMCINASRKIHDSMFANLLQATMRFFDTNPSGRILNRFTKDVGAMDEVVPTVMSEMLHVLIVTLGIFTLVALANNWMIIPEIIIFGLFCIARIYYLKTALAVKRLEGVAKSPMFSHAISTLDGLTTIRSTGAQAERLLRREFDRHQDTHTGAWDLNIAIATAFGLIIDLILCFFVACICSSFILMDDENTLGGFVGLAISQSVTMTIIVQYGVRQSTELMSEMTSVERVLQYTNLPKEEPFTTDNPPPPVWPSKGALVFKDVSMRYADHKPPVLKNLNLSINPGWKIGVVGRTGAGKSSLISALFRLTGDGLEGEIVLDGIDTKSIGLHELRPRVSIIPQEPILFSASLRQNLDPFEQYSDAELWDSLREVELGDVVPSLDFQVTGGGSNFSVGQRQLICLARAILKNNRILVLDEATANVDHATDALIQKTIRRRFADCTVLTIAHRLNTIMDSDRVLVTRDGCIVEFGHPHLLLKNPDGHFSGMLQQTGMATAEKLARIAENAYLLSPEFERESNELPSSSSTEYVTHL